jgi:RNA polymerase sigma factor (sigma-70 family)
MSVAATTQGTGFALRLTSDPPEPYEVREVTHAYNLAAVRAQKHREWVAEMYREYFDQMVRFVERRVSNKDEAADIVQDGFIALFTKATKETIIFPRAWIYRTCRWELRKYYAACARNKARRLSDFRGNGPCPRDTRTQRPEEIAEYRELRRGIEQELLTFTPLQRGRIELRVFDEMETGDVGRACGMTKEAAWLSIYRGLKLLRARFADLKPRNKPFKLKTTNGGHYRMTYDLWCVDLNRKFGSVQAAADFACVKTSAIIGATTGKASSAGGHKWEWRERPDGSRRDFSPAQKEYWSRFARKRAAAAAG